VGYNLVEIPEMLLIHIKINMEKVELRLWIVYEKLSPLRAIIKRQPALFFWLRTF
jgi:hypothetical protein